MLGVGIDDIKARNSSSPVALIFTGALASSYVSKKDVSAPEQVTGWGQTAAILAAPPSPQAAKFFMSLITSKAFQANSAKSTLMSLNKANSVDLYGSNITDITKFRLWEHDRGTVESRKNLFEEVLSAPQGLGPLEMYPKPASL